MNILSLDDKNLLEEKIIEEIFNRVLTKKPKNEAFFTSYLNKKLEEIFKLEVNYLGLKYYKSNSKRNEIAFEIIPKTNNTTKGTFTFFSYIPKVTLYSQHSDYYDILSDDPERRIKGVKTYIKTLFHELRHLKQYLLTQANVSNKNVLRNAKELLLISNKTKSVEKLYKEYHDSFAIEADAIIKSYNKLNNLIKEDYQQEDDLFDLAISESNRDYFDFVVDNKVLNRNRFISSSIDYNIHRIKNNDYFHLMPILLKEYNQDGSKKRISELITNMKNELLVANFLKEEDNKEQVKNDILEFYYELIFNRLVEKDEFELYEAINDHSLEDVRNIISNIRSYITKEKKSILKLLKEKCNAEVKKKIKPDAKTHNEFNNGKIKVNSLNNVELISTESFVKKINNKDNNRTKESLLGSKVFRRRIPNYGYYYLNNGTKISVNSFIDNIFLKEFNNLPLKTGVAQRYSEILFKYVKNPYETEYLHNCEKINKKAQEQDAFLESLLKHPILSKNTLKIDDSIYELMKVVKDIENPNTLAKICDYMLSSLAFTEDEYYYSFNSSQISYFDMLYKVAKLLNTNTYLNPKKFDYYKLFKNNQTIIDINNEIKRYLKIINNNKTIKTK